MNEPEPGKYLRPIQQADHYLTAWQSRLTGKDFCAPGGYVKTGKTGIENYPTTIADHTTLH